MRRKGFTLIELLVVVAIIALLIGILLPSLSRAKELSNRTVCSSRLNGIFKAWGVYAAAYKDRYPYYASAGADTQPDGFNGSAVNTAPADPNDPWDSTNSALTDNLTAILWTTVREGETGVGNFLCPSDNDGIEDEQLASDGTPITDEDESWDFGDEGATGAPVSYSMMEFYSDEVGVNWSPVAGSDWVFMADDNNNDGTNGTAANLHTHAQADLDDGTIDQETVENEENSSHHRFEGQNILFGDSHVDFETTPFHGPNTDNVYAVNTDPETSTAPAVAGDDADNKRDVVLLPLTGAGGTTLDKP